MPTVCFQRLQAIKFRVTAIRDWKLQLADMCGMFWRAVTAVYSLLVIEMQNFLAAAYNNFAHSHAVNESTRKCIVCSVQTTANTTVPRQHGSDAVVPDYNVD